MGLQQRRVDEIVGINNTLGQSTGQLTVVLRIDNLFRVVLALFASVAADVVDETHIGKLAVHLVVDAVCDGTAGFAEHDVLLTNTTVPDHRTHQGQRHEG